MGKQWHNRKPNHKQHRYSKTFTERYHEEEEERLSEEQGRDMKEEVIEAIMNRACTDRLYNRLDSKQKQVYHAIVGKDKEVIFMNCKAGTGKTLIMIMGGLELIRLRIVTGIDYIRVPTSRGERLGYTKGTTAEKEAKYMTPVYDALTECGISPYHIPILQNMGIINLSSDVSLRGCNLRKRVVIFDEAQSADMEDQKLIYTRVHDGGGKLLIAGHSGQVDSKVQRISGLLPFEVFQMHGEGIPWIGQYTLTTNYRGKISQWADNVDKTIKELRGEGIC